MKKLLCLLIFFSITFCSKDEDTNKCVICPSGDIDTTELEGLCVGAKVPDDETGEMITLDEASLQLMIEFLNAFGDTGCELK